MKCGRDNAAIKSAQPKSEIQSDRTFTFSSAMCSEPEDVMCMLSNDRYDRSIDIEEMPPPDDPEPIRQPRKGHEVRLYGGLFYVRAGAENRVIEVTKTYTSKSTSVTK
jgi:hypothetical protein